MYLTLGRCLKMFLWNKLWQTFYARDSVTIRIFYTSMIIFTKRGLLGKETPLSISQQRILWTRGDGRVTRCTERLCSRWTLSGLPWKERLATAEPLQRPEGRESRARGSNQWGSDRGPRRKGILLEQGLVKTVKEGRRQTMEQRKCWQAEALGRGGYNYRPGTC